MDQHLENINIKQIDILTPPKQLKSDLPIGDSARSSITNNRQAIRNILEGKDKRLLVITGPCSIHDIESAKEYARRLKVLHDKHKKTLFIVMRVYFEKPRTNTGWKGFINDPDLNNTFDINKGLKSARALLLWLAELGLPTATEALDPITPQYLSDLISWSAIGARTTESQTHREMASGLSMPVGFKNGTDGGLDVAINALIAASAAHSFIGIDNRGKTALLSTTGNKSAHIILRGGKTPNYDRASVAACEKKLLQQSLCPRMIIDCSHGNSSKDYRKQPLVLNNIIQQITDGNQSIAGVMLESHLNAGNQKIRPNLAYGQSITDGCIDWDNTEALLDDTSQQLKILIEEVA